MEYKVDDKGLDAAVFLPFVNRIWPGDGKTLVGCLRILSDGCYFGTITELLVLPAYQKRGIGSRLLQLARENAPTMLYFGAQPGLEEFYEKNGCRRSLQSYIIERKNG